MRDWIESASVFALAGGAVYVFIQVPYLVAGWAMMLPGTTDRSLSPSFFPRIALATLIVFCLLTGTAALRRALSGEPGISLDFVPAASRTAAACGWILYLIGYLLAMWAVGFYLSSALLIFGMGFLAGYRRTVPLLAIAIVSPLAVEMLFRDVLRMVLPRGHYQDFSLNVYLFGY